MAFTPEEMQRIANAALDFYHTPDNLTPRERARKRVREARRKLREAQNRLSEALAYKAEVRRMPVEYQIKRWERHSGILLDGPAEYGP